MSSLVHSEFEASLGGKKSNPDPLPAKKKKWCLVYIANQDSQGYVENKGDNSSHHLLTMSGSFGESWILQNKETLSQTEILKLEQVQRQGEGAQCHPFTEQQNKPQHFVALNFLQRCVIPALYKILGMPQGFSSSLQNSK